MVEAVMAGSGCWQQVGFEVKTDPIVAVDRTMHFDTTQRVISSLEIILTSPPNVELATRISCPSAGVPLDKN